MKNKVKIIINGILLMTLMVIFDVNITFEVKAESPTPTCSLAPCGETDVITNNGHAQGNIPPDDYKEDYETYDYKSTSCSDGNPKCMYETQTKIMVEIAGQRVPVELCPTTNTRCVGGEFADIPSALNPDGSSNEKYQEQMDAWIDSAIVDGELVDGHPYAEALKDAMQQAIDAGKLTCSSSDMSKCVGAYVAWKREQSDGTDDGVGTVYLPGLIMTSISDGNYQICRGVTHAEGDCYGMTPDQLTSLCGSVWAGSEQTEFGISREDFCKGTADLINKLCSKTPTTTQTKTKTQTKTPTKTITKTPTKTVTKTVTKTNTQRKTASPTTTKKTVTPTQIPGCTHDYTPPEVPEMEPIDPPTYGTYTTTPGYQNFNPQPTKSHVVTPQYSENYSSNIPDMVCGKSYKAQWEERGNNIGGDYCGEYYINHYSVDASGVKNNLQEEIGSEFSWGYVHGSTLVTQTKTAGTLAAARKRNADIDVENLEIQLANAKGKHDIANYNYNLALSNYNIAQNNATMAYNNYRIATANLKLIGEAISEANSKISQVDADIDNYKKGPNGDPECGPYDYNQLLKDKKEAQDKVDVAQAAYDKKKEDLQVDEKYKTYNTCTSKPSYQQELKGYETCYNNYSQCLNKYNNCKSKYGSHCDVTCFHECGMGCSSHCTYPCSSEASAYNTANYQLQSSEEAKKLSNAKKELNEIQEKINIMDKTIATYEAAKTALNAVLNELKILQTEQTGYQAQYLADYTKFYADAQKLNGDVTKYSKILSDAKGEYENMKLYYNQNIGWLRSEAEKYQGCVTDWQNASTGSYTDPSAITTSDVTMTLCKNGKCYEKQVLGASGDDGSVIAIEKNSGDLLKLGTKYENGFESGIISLDYIPNNSIAINNPLEAFVIPVTALIGNYPGALTEKVTLNLGSGRNAKTFNIVCDLTIPPFCTDPPCPPTCTNPPCEGIDIIFRPISLSDPFPNTSTDADSRKRLGDWYYNSTVNIVIHNNRDVEDDAVYTQKPMYTFVLDAATIKDIRTYNKTHSYSDFDLRCEGGLYCKSNFIWQTFNYAIDGSNSCAMNSNNWYSCFSPKLENFMRGYYYYINQAMSREGA